MEGVKPVYRSTAYSHLCAQALIPLALEGTDAGKVKASHALAKIASISNPEIAFPGERVSPLFCFFTLPSNGLVFVP